MNRSRLIFFVIVGAALVLVIGGILVDQLGQQESASDSSPDTNSSQQGPLEITVAASPVIVDWIDGAAQAYNAQRRQVDGRVVQIRVQTQDGLPIWNSPGQWSRVSHPVAWIADATFAVEYANDVGLQFSIVQPSIASTVMLWGAPEDRAQVIIDKYGSFNWDSIQKLSTESSWSAVGGNAAWGAFKPAFAQPDRYTSGLVAFLIAVAEFRHQPVLDSAALNDSAMSSWLAPVVRNVPNFASLGMYPAETLAARGASVGDVALLPESEWLVNYRSLTNRLGAIRLVYPDMQFWFDFPFAIWDDAETTHGERAAAQDFLSFLMGSEQQSRAAAFGLRQPDGTPAVSTLFQQATGVSLAKPTQEAIQMPSRNEVKPFVSRNWTAF